MEISSERSCSIMKICAEFQAICSLRMSWSWPESLLLDLSGKIVKLYCFEIRRERDLGSWTCRLSKNRESLQGFGWGKRENECFERERAGFAGFLG